MPSSLRLPLLTGALTIALVPTLLADAPWPQFRGPDANPVGTHEKLPDRWSTSENVEWSIEVPGRGWSSPIVVGDKVFLTTVTTEGKSKEPQMGTDYSNEYAAELSKQGLSDEEVMKRVMQRDMEMPDEVMLHYFLYCLKLDDGKVLWNKEIFAGHPPGGRHRKNSFMSETPVTDGERVYVYIGNLGLYAFDLDGEKSWSAAFEAMPIYLEFGTGSSPVVTGNQIIIVNDNEKQQFIASFDSKTGKQLWRTDRNTSQSKDADTRRSAWATPFVWKNSERTEIVTIGTDNAISYDLEGKELWRLSGFTQGPAPSPFAYDGVLYLDAGPQKPMFAVRPGASGDISLKEGETSTKFVMWKTDRAGTYIPTPVAYDGSLYVLFDKGIIARIDAKTGRQDYKARISKEDGAFTSSPWAYNGKVFCLSEEGNTYVLSAGDSFEIERVNPLGEMALASPAIIGERLLIRTAGHLYSIREMKGLNR